MPIACRFGGFRKFLKKQGLALKEFYWVGAISQCAHHSRDSNTGARSFAQPHLLSYGQLDSPTHSRPQYSSVLRGCEWRNNSSNNFIQDQVGLACSHPTQKQHLSRQEVRRMLRLLHINIIKRTLSSIPEAYISYAQLVKLCRDFTEEDQGKDIIDILERSGHILRIGKRVYLHPDKVARALERVLRPLVVDDSCRQELEKMREEKAEIDIESEKLVRYEMWGGLGFLSIQTVLLVRLTFWELSWDVMEPICFYLTSIYFMLGYAFFIRTSRHPTFESFFAARFKIKQRKLMKMRNFSLERYRKLQRILMDRSN